MENKNNKGFTLIELLAVVVILLAISVIAITSISAAIERNRAKQYNSKKSVIESAAMAYYSQHKNSIANGDKINVGDLELSDDELVDADGEKICGYVNVINNEFQFERVNCDNMTTTDISSNTTKRTTTVKLKDITTRSTTTIVTTNTMFTVEKNIDMCFNKTLVFVIACQPESNNYVAQCMIKMKNSTSSGNISDDIFNVPITALGYPINGSCTTGGAFDR